MYKYNIYCFAFWLNTMSILFLSGCSPKQPPMNPSIRMHFNKLTISWNGKDRISGLIPHLQNTNIKFHEVHTTRTDSSETCEFVHNFKDHVEIRAVVSEKTNTIVIYLSPNNFHTQKANDFVGVFFDSIPGFVAGNAFHKYGPVSAWTHPDIVDSPHKIQDKDNQFFFWKYDDGTYGACLPLIGKGYVSSIGKYKNNLGVMAYHSLDGHNENNIPVLAISFGKNPKDLIENLYKNVKDKNNNLDSIKRMNETSVVLNKLGWCSWNASGHAINHEKLIEAAKSFKNNNIPVKWMLIDDGWQTVTGKNGKLKSFNPSPDKFPLGLAHTVKMLKDDFGIEKVGVWHTINGYWAGIEPTSELGERYRKLLHAYNDKVTWTEEPTSVFFLPKPEGGNVFFEDWYQYLSNEGIDFVKVDNQLISQKVAKGNSNYENTAASLQSNFQVPALTFFNEKILNCMCLTNDVLFNLPFGAIARSSEDYFPENTSFNIKAGNEAVHVYNNIHNNLWLSHLGISDFDMFQSHRPNAFYHALARVLNNGPVYLTDFPSQHHVELVQAMALPNGTLLKATSPLLPTDESIFYEIDKGIITATSHYNDTLLLGAWNTTPQPHTKLLKLSTFLPSKQTYLVYDWKKETIHEMDSESDLTIELDATDCKHFLVFETNQTDTFFPVGLKDKLLPIAGLAKFEVEEKHATVHLKQEGDFIAFCSKEISSVEETGEKGIYFEQVGKMVKINSAPRSFKINFI